jgi:two-component system, OmpR family, sensor histidine kinase VicK
LTYRVLFDALWNQTDLYGQLQVHHRMQKEFIDTVAHELRTPLTPIIGLTKHVKDQLENKDQRRLLDIVIYNGKKLQALSENILVLTKMEGNMLNITKEDFNLNSVILNAIKEFKVRLEKIQYINEQDKKKIHFELHGFDNKFMINADRYRISQIIYNLLENAINFILDKDGLISITIEKKATNDMAFVHVPIKDTGEGIHSEILSTLFTKFATKSFYGTGLGLYICKQIIEMHQGRIGGENNKDSRGATFSFSLPLNY